MKETRYHLRHASDWLIRFGTGTGESARRAQEALNHLLPYTQEFWLLADYEEQAVSEAVAVDPRTVEASWHEIVAHVVSEAGLRLPDSGGHRSTGKCGVHSEHLSYLLADMQSLARAHPEGVW